MTLVDNVFDLPDGIPEEIGGVGVCLIERRYEPFVAPDLDRYVDLRGGIHILHPEHSDDGTRGAIVQGTSAIAFGQRLGLSCSHVVGDRGGPGFPFTVWQPNNPAFPSPASPKDDNVGEVVRAAFPDLDIGGLRVGVVDAAVFALDEAFQQGRTASGSIMGQDRHGPNLADAITGVARAHATMRVRKRGAMTRVAHGIVAAPRPSTPWPSLGSAPNRFLLGSMEIVVDRNLSPDGMFVEPGDSGSVVLTHDQPIAVGMLWGGTRSGRGGP